eukprot:SAG11_NODE_78_length_17939_cov_10.236883_3_plen_227_part_00
MFNYAQFHVADKELLETLRATAAQSGPCSEVLELCVRYADEAAIAALAPHLSSLLRTAVGLPSRAGVGRFIVQLFTYAALPIVLISCLFFVGKSWVPRVLYRIEFPNFSRFADLQRACRADEALCGAAVQDTSGSSADRAVRRPAACLWRLACQLLPPCQASRGLDRGSGAPCTLPRGKQCSGAPYGGLQLPRAVSVVQSLPIIQREAHQTQQSRLQPRVDGIGEI